MIQEEESKLKKERRENGRKELNAWKEFIPFKPVNIRTKSC